MTSALHVLLTVVLFFLIVFMAILLFFLFPIFVIISRKNRKKDQELAIYPIINHCFKPPKFISNSYNWNDISYHVLHHSSSKYHIFIYIYICLTVVLLLSALLYIPILRSVWKLVHLASAIENKPQKYILYQTLCIAVYKMVSLLVIFYVYLGHTEPNPPINLKNLVDPPKQQVYTILKLINVSFFTFQIAIIVIVMTSNPAVSEEELIAQACRFLSYCHLLLALLLGLSSSLYIPILISVRKSSHLISAVQNKPHNYILYQTLCIVVYKMITVLAVVWVNVDSIEQLPAEHIDKTQEYLIVVLYIIDMLSTPVFIQISYLLCNRRNVVLLKQLLSIRNFKIWIMKRILRNNSVAPANVYGSNDEILGPSTIS
ncbi:Protein CBG04918 [Caenorhabditis briggsae]|uniref:Protein CBG04918 n=1 Tax=Caenorhabditis briggsae TaxID=6238 RepID=A8WYT0_CAEBR|nr:Protein CBG04918 [Caenorhabditis briggsae]CAP25538.1 Protein CBG04918 [Caenorhabditis briggsae]